MVDFQNGIPAQELNNAKIVQIHNQQFIKVSLSCVGNLPNY